MLRRVTVDPLILQRFTGKLDTWCSEQAELERLRRDRASRIQALEKSCAAHAVELEATASGNELLELLLAARRPDLPSPT